MKTNKLKLGEEKNQSINIEKNRLSGQNTARIKKDELMTAIKWDFKKQEITWAVEKEKG